MSDVPATPQWTRTSRQNIVYPGAMQLLRGVCLTHRLPELGEHLAQLLLGVENDLSTIEAGVDELLGGRQLIERGAAVLLKQRGKRLRPLCVVLASRIGTGFGETARSLAVAVELVHSATLLHDDVVDTGEARRGAPTARLVYGNAVSIFAGDWLLVEALKRVRQTKLTGIFDALLQTVEEMIFAESLQLAQRHRCDGGPEVYFRIVEGKTASLFRWALSAGATAGESSASCIDSLGEYGAHLGVSFQLVDDLLDYTGDPQLTGKTLLTDLQEGKMTYPLLVATDENPLARQIAEEIMHAGEPIGSREAPESLRRQVQSLQAMVNDSRGIQATLAEAKRRSDKAVDSLAGMPEGAAVSALRLVAQGVVSRDN